MCKFCDDLSWRKYSIPARNKMDSDNLCQCLSRGRIDGSPETDSDAPVFCHTKCDGCAEGNEHFELFSRDNRIGLSFAFKAKGLQIARNSEMLTINFCPWCGKKLTEQPVEFEKSVRDLKQNKSPRSTSCA